MLFNDSLLAINYQKIMGLKPVSFKTKIFGGSIETYHGMSLLRQNYLCPLLLALCPFDKGILIKKVVP